MPSDRVAPIQVPIVDENNLVSREWALYFQNLDVVDPGTDWTPTFVNLTGTPVITARFYKINRYETSISITLVGTSTSTAGSTYISNFPRDINYDTTVSAANATTNIGLTNGIAKASNNRIYTPAWSVVGNTIVVSGIIQTSKE